MSNGAPAADESHDMGTAGLAGRNTLEISVIRALSQRSDLRGMIRFGTHLLCLVVTGTLVCYALPRWEFLIPAMILHGFVLSTMFAPMHECVHRTAFDARWMNEVAGWIAGLLSFYNFTFYRHYHTWHHRYTQDPERDPELMDPKPHTVWQYLVELSGVMFWLRRPLTFLKLATRQTRAYPFVPERARTDIAISASIQLLIYAIGIGTIAGGYQQAWWLFFFPSLLGQPLLRAILIVEHTGCSHDENGLTNTRTTLTNPFIRLVMWNMSYHTEHHLYPSIPFHHLPAAHQQLKQRLIHLSPNYVLANRSVVQSFGTEPSTTPTP